jgi:hypothetical protein
MYSVRIPIVRFSCVSLRVLYRLSCYITRLECPPCGKILTGATLAGSNLREGILHLGVERVLGHDEDDGQVFVNEGKGTVLEFTGQDLRISSSSLGLIR